MVASGVTPTREPAEKASTSAEEKYQHSETGGESRLEELVGNDRLGAVERGCKLTRKSKLGQRKERIRI